MDRYSYNGSTNHAGHESGSSGEPDWYLYSLYCYLSAYRVCSLFIRQFVAVSIMATKRSVLPRFFFLSMPFPNTIMI